MGITSNNVRACLYLGDLLQTNSRVGRKDLISIQKMDYSCRRPRNASGHACGPTQSTILTLSVKTLPDGELRELYRRIREDEAFAFSVIFSPVFADRDPMDNHFPRYRYRGFLDDCMDGYLRYFDSAFVAMGAITDINEAFNLPAVDVGEADAAHAQNGPVALMTTQIRISLESINYIGENGNHCRLNIKY